MVLNEFCILKQQICKFISIGGHWCWGGHWVRLSGINQREGVWCVNYLISLAK